MRMKPPPWGNEETQKILDILEKYNIKATFFVTGEWVRKYPKDVKKIAEAGHDLGNYSEHYKNMKGLSEEECRREIMEVHQKVKALTGVEMNLFRCPHGEYDNEMMKNVTNCGYYPIQWSVDSSRLERLRSGEHHSNGLRSHRTEKWSDYTDAQWG